MGVHRAPPCRLASVRVPDNWDLRHSSDLQDLATIVLRLLPDEFRVEVNLHFQSLLQSTVGKGLNGPLQRTQRLQEAHGELCGGIPDLFVVDSLKPILIQIFKHLPAIRDKELAALLSCLEADEQGCAWSTVANHLVVHAYIELPSRRLVHSLVHTCLLVHGIAGCDGVQRVLAALKLKSLTDLRKTRALFRQLEAPEDNRSVLLQILIDLRQIFSEISTLSIEIASQLGRHLHLQGARDLLHVLALRGNIDVLLSIHGVRAIRQRTGSPCGHSR
mmetsp:Transcript_88236/g.222700  ORF Transcript_88236/g.222700 Transcript_88236/m.222700 type:complete len:275 (-) Transcript_88236:377-1201(-)